MTLIYPFEQLSGWLAEIFAACGLEARPAETAAELLVRTEARGITTHGLVRAPIYARRLREGALNPKARPRFDERSGVVHCYGDGGLGQVVCAAAVDDALARSGETAVVVTMLHDLGHMAALGVFALRAAEAGRLCVLMQSTPAVMALPGARRPAIGNNPIAFATPVADGPPLVFDMAASAVARGNLLAAARAGRPIPDDWALDSEGRPTSDAEAALGGMLLPAAGHKGIGLAMMVECLAGSLTGTVPISGRGRSVVAPSRVGGFLLVLDPGMIVGEDTYARHLHDWIAGYKDATGDDARYPGERAAEREAVAHTRGIELSHETVEELRDLGELVDVPFLAA